MPGHVVASHYHNKTYNERSDNCPDFPSWQFHDFFSFLLKVAIMLWNRPFANTYHVWVCRCKYALCE